MTDTAPVPQRIFEWLLRLHAVTAGNSAGPEAAERVNLVAPMLAERFPLDAFTRRSLEHVAAENRFWPSYGELVASLSPWWRDNRPRPTALPAPPEPEPDPVGEQLTDEQRDQVLAEFRAAWTALRSELAERRLPERERAAGQLRDVSLKGDALRASRAARGCDVPVRDDDELGPPPPDPDEEAA